MVLAIVGLAAPAGAQTQDPAAARALFEEATKALDGGDWDGACPRFDGSFALKPTVSALLNIAKCHEHAGKLTLASDDYQRALSLNEDTVSQTRKKELAEYAAGAVRALKARIPRLRIVVKDAPADLHVTRDGQELPATTLEIGLPVDPGEHVVVASAAGRKTQTSRVILAEGRDTDLALDLAADVPAPAAPPPPALPPPASAPAPLPVAARGSAPAWAWISGAVGIVLGGAAVGFAVDGARANCGGPCTSDRFQQSDLDALNGRRHRDLGVGLALGIAGTAGLVAGVIGITAPRARPAAGLAVRPLLGRALLGMALEGGF